MIVQELAKPATGENLDEVADRELVSTQGWSTAGPSLPFNFCRDYLFIIPRVVAGSPPCSTHSLTLSMTSVLLYRGSRDPGPVVPQISSYLLSRHASLAPGISFTGLPAIIDSSHFRPYSS
ncbi:hypothetical protein J6590_052203 [Homalodisca vitripennis]|nr:hypothetical protein J6590_052203 [Homalodisca vitripennis]